MGPAARRNRHEEWERRREKVTTIDGAASGLGISRGSAYEAARRKESDDPNWTSPTRADRAP